jgi:predicted outer membrane lipoprotein
VIIPRWFWLLGVLLLAAVGCVAAVKLWQDSQANRAAEERHLQMIGVRQ